jgi:hypothetical protein
MLRIVIIIALLFVAVAAHAQQQPSPNEQAMGAKLMQEIQQGLSCSASLIGVQAELAKANAGIKELEKPKDEPEKK